MSPRSGIEINGRVVEVEILESREYWYCYASIKGRKVLVCYDERGEVWITKAPRGEGDIFNQGFYFPELRDLPRLAPKWLRAKDGAKPESLDPRGLPTGRGANWQWVEASAV
jgi:hypothetical protein